MLQTVQKTMVELNMVEAGDCLLAGVSGGADSVCLLLLLKELEPVLKFSLEAVHVEHGIRGAESLRDEQFVVDLCKQHEIPLTCMKVDVPAYSKENSMSLEEAARVLRYEAFSTVAEKKHAKVALAHHMEDNAETILFQMLRGSSLTGLCGMRPLREDVAGVVYIRPLLRVHRKEIEDMLAVRGQAYCTDSTNKELEYSRNYLRNVVLPQLTQVNEQAVAHINGTAERLENIRDFLMQESEKAWAEVVTSTLCENAEKRRVCLSIEALTTLHPALQKELVLKAIAEAAGSRKDIAAVHVADVLDLCRKQSGKEIRLPYQVVAKRDFDTLVIYKNTDNGEEATAWTEISENALAALYTSGEILEVPLGKPNEFLRMRVFPYHGKSAKLPKKTYTKWLDYDKIKQGFCIRTRQSGDYFIGDSSGHHKKLKSYFVDEKISVTEREQMWILAQESLVLWLIGGRISEHMKVTEQTNAIIEIEYQGGN